MNIQFDQINLKFVAKALKLLQNAFMIALPEKDFL
jgi:hypothetical protein